MSNNAKDWRDEVQAVERLAHTALHQPAADQRNILEDIAERLSRLLAAHPLSRDAAVRQSYGYVTHGG